jgi:hypothetical protein
MSYWLHTEIELEEAAAFYANEGGSRVANTFLDEFEHIVSILENNQKIGGVIQHGFRHFLFCQFPYSVIYRESGTGLKIFAIAHQKRKPEYWLYRIK